MSETVTQFDMCYIILLKGWALVNEWTKSGCDQNIILHDKCSTSSNRTEVCMLWWEIVSVELEGQFILIIYRNRTVLVPTLSFNNVDVVSMYACEVFINGRHIHGKPKLLEI